MYLVLVRGVCVVCISEYMHVHVCDVYVVCVSEYICMEGMCSMYVVCLSVRVCVYCVCVCVCENHFLLGQYQLAIYRVCALQ